jgi:hypothetical protein
MTDLTARETVEKLHQYDDLRSFPKINIHLLATAPGNEHLLKFMTEKPDNPIRFKGKRIAIIATHGVEETEVSIPRKWLEARGAICHLVSPNHIEYTPAFGIQFPEIAKTHVLAIQFTENSGWIPIDARIEEAADDAVYVPGGVESGSAARQPSRVVLPSKISGDRQTLGRAVPRLPGALSHLAFLLLITYLTAGLGFNRFNGLASRWDAAIEPLLARCDNAFGGPRHEGHPCG